MRRFPEVPSHSSRRAICSSCSSGLDQIFSSYSGWRLQRAEGGWLGVLLLHALKIWGQEATQPAPVTINLPFCVPTPNVKLKPEWAHNIQGFLGGVLGYKVLEPDPRRIGTWWSSLAALQKGLKIYGLSPT